MMAMPIMTVVSVVPVSGKRSATGLRRRERTTIYEGSSSPRELLQAIATQAQAAMKGLEIVKSTDVGLELTEEQKRMPQKLGKRPEQEDAVFLNENKNMMDFCRRILNTIKAIDRSLRDTKGDEFVNRLHSSLLQNLGAEKKIVQVSAGASEEAVKKAYMEWAISTRFEYCDLSIEKTPDEQEDQAPHYKFYYSDDARMLANADIPKRSLAIAKEVGFLTGIQRLLADMLQLAILSTNLPVAWDSSIFLRVDETRVDVIKALITGPEGTP